MNSGPRQPKLIHAAVLTFQYLSFSSSVTATYILWFSWLWLSLFLDLLFDLDFLLAVDTTLTKLLPFLLLEKVKEGPYLPIAHTAMLLTDDSLSLNIFKI